MTPIEEAEYAAGLDLVSPRPIVQAAGDDAQRGSLAFLGYDGNGDPITARVATQVATCRECGAIVAGTHLGPRCPNGHPWAVRDAADLDADPELRRLAGDFRLPEDDERRRLDAGAAARFERRDEA